MQSPSISLVKDISEEELRTFLFKNPKTIVKYHSHSNLYADHIAQIYNELSGHQKYREISFLRINAHENPVALNVVKLKNAPFLLTYHNGLLIDCSNVKSGEEVVNLLDKLVLN